MPGGGVGEEAGFCASQTAAEAEVKTLFLFIEIEMLSPWCVDASSSQDQSSWRLRRLTAELLLATEAM